MAQAAGNFAPILSPVDRIIARRRVRTIVRAAIACALAVMAGLVVIKGAQHLGARAIEPLSILVIVGSMAALASSLFAWTSRFSPVEEAFLIDRVNGFDQAYGTAVDLAYSRAPISQPVPIQLMATVSARLGRISVSRLVPIFTPGLLAALVLLVALGATAWLLERAPVSVPRIVTESTPSAPADVATLETVAEMLQEEARIQQDPLLEAIARTLADRALATAGEPMSEQTQRQINDLLDQAAAFYDENVPGWLGSSQGSRLLELEQALANMDPADAPGAAPPLELAIDPYAVQPDDMPSWDALRQYDTPPDRAGQIGTEDVAEGGDMTSQSTPALMGTAPGQGPQLMQPDELEGAGAIPIGAALDSGRGVSEAAGLGSEEFRSDDDFARLGFRPVQDMVVGAEPGPQGRRIRIEIVPQTAQERESGGANIIGGQTGTGSAEPVARTTIPASARDITARYFARTAQ